MEGLAWSLQGSDECYYTQATLKRESLLSLMESTGKAIMNNETLLRLGTSPSQSGTLKCSCKEFLLLDRCTAHPATSADQP